MEKVAGYLQTLYKQEEPHPPGLTLVSHLDLDRAKNTNPTEAEVEAEVLRLRPLKAVIRTHLCMYHFKKWIREAYPGGKYKPPPPPRTVPWMCLVDIIHNMWRTGEIP